MANIFDLSLRGINFVFLVIILGLTGSLIHGQDGSNSRVNFALFTAVFGIVTSSFYGVIAQFLTVLAFPIVLTILDFLNFVFTLSAAAALATGIRVHSCTNQEYLDDNNITQGSSDRCRKAQASTAFLFFSFAVFAISLGFQAATWVSSGAFGIRRSRKGAAGPTIATA